MTVKEIIDYIDKLRPNSFDFATKLIWINEVEGMVQSEIMKRPLDKISVLVDKNDYVSVKHPYTQMYGFYLVSMIDFFSGDYVKFQNSSAAYNDALKLYAKYVARGNV